MTLELTFTEEGKNSDQLSDLRTPSSSQTGQQYISLYATESRPSTVMLTRIIFLSSSLSRTPFIFYLDHILNDQWDHLKSHQNLIIFYLFHHIQVFQNCLKYLFLLYLKNKSTKPAWVKLKQKGQRVLIFKVIKTKSKLAIIWKTVVQQVFFLTRSNRYAHHWKHYRKIHTPPPPAPLCWGLTQLSKC